MNCPTIKENLYLGRYRLVKMKSAVYEKDMDPFSNC